MVLNLEYPNLVLHGTWDVKSCPIDVNVLACKWAFTLKYYPYDIVARQKVGFVAIQFT